MDRRNRGEELGGVEAHVVVVGERNGGTDGFSYMGVEGSGERRRGRWGGRGGKVDRERGEEHDIGSVGP